MNINKQKDSAKKVINSGPINVISFVIGELALITIIIVISALLISDYDAVSFELKIIYFLSLPVILLWGIFMGFLFGSHIVLTDDEVGYFGIGKLLGIFDHDNSTKILKFAERVRYSDILSVYEQCEDSIPYTKPQKYIVLNMKDGTSKKIPVNMYSKYRIKYVISEMIEMSGHRILQLKKFNGIDDL